VGLFALRLSLIVASFGMLEGLSAGNRRSEPTFCSGESERSEVASSMSLSWLLMVLSSVLLEAEVEMKEREGIYL
jgi:hypothetical protein